MIQSRCVRLPLATVLTSFLVSLSAVAQQFVDVEVPGGGGGFSGESLAGGISDDGRLVAFSSEASNLVAGDGQNQDVFVRDLTLGTTVRITSDAPAFYTGVRISGNGNVVGYSTQPVPGADMVRQTYLFDRTTQTSVQILASLFEVTLQDLSADGRFALVTARFLNAQTSPIQVLRVDATDGSFVLCSRDANGNPVFNEFSQQNIHPVIDEDGTHVAFASQSAALVVGDTNNARDVFVLDIPGNVMARVSVATDGSESSVGAARPSISADGRFVTFETSASTFALGDTNGVTDVYLRDLRLETTTRVSLTTFQGQYVGSSLVAAISPDGRQVAFQTLVSTGPFSFRWDLHVRDLENGFTLTPDFAGAFVPFLLSTVETSADGRRILVSRQNASGQLLHVQVLDFGPPCTIAGYCSANVNSTGNAASLGAQGSASRELNNLVFAVVGMPDTAVALLYSGTSAIDPGTPFGDGLKCVGGTIVRHSVQQAVLGTIIDAQDVHSLEYANVHPGDTRYYQVLYRDPAAGGAGFNTTDAAAVTFCW